MNGNIRSELIQKSDIKTKQSGERFFKEDVKIYGVKTAIVTKISRNYFKEVKTKSKQEIIELCETLFKSSYMEEAIIACKWSFYIDKRYESNDINIFETWIKKYVSNWAVCDTFCNHTVGSFLQRYPENINKLKEWAHSDNRWMRRASAVSLIIPARHGFFTDDIFEIADILLMDSDDLVQKGYGWMLKAASQAEQNRVYEYVISKRDIMPRTSLRYAIEKMPVELRTEAMKK